MEKKFWWFVSILALTSGVTIVNVETSTILYGFGAGLIVLAIIINAALVFPET